MTREELSNRYVAILAHDCLYTSILQGTAVETLDSYNGWSRPEAIALAVAINDRLRDLHVVVADILDLIPAAE